MGNYQTGTNKKDNDVIEHNIIGDYFNNYIKQNNLSSDNNFKFSNILCEVLWIHSNRFKNSNNIFKSALTKRNLQFKEVSDPTSGIEELKKIHYRCIYVVVSGSMFQEFIQKFQENISEISCIPIITIFALNIEKYQKLKYANHPFYNSGGIHREYDGLIQTFLKFDSIITNKIEKNIISPVYNNECFNFEKIDSIPKLYFPFIYSKFIKRIDDNDIHEFHKNILKYDNEDIKKLIYPLVNLSEIPIEILVKFWLRIYTLETGFYSNMNCKLMKLKGKEFETFIKLIYFALNEKYLKNRCDICLYRGDILNNEELNTIIDKSKSDSIKDKLIYSRKFLSFSSVKEVAENFIKDKYIQNKNKLNYILFKINPYEGNIDEAKCYNIEMKNYSKFKNEEEYLFLPYSPFIIDSTETYNIPLTKDTNISVNLIDLSYIGTFKDIIKTSMKNISNLDELSFSLLEKYFMDEIKKYKIFDEEENIWEKIKSLIKNNEI